jgi:hypothetical protein
MSVCLGGDLAAKNSNYRDTATQSFAAQQSRNQSVWRFTPKAFANFSPSGLERSDNPGITALLGINAESVRQIS